ncbi:tyrosine-type recombinase/integrase [Lutimaribacter saemankumensis]|uniref:Site-specific recombinase XerD n=1 Tax=Lutimaribacter saemankumensis TaxID=490829 RepID=A0A1G8NMI6_9RHOB|nr:site-specific integrase [Lutimaribacter saemankumensis]SDI81403.1 Site-specific recombinase XerD [Lutimaribacter saemankumensis]
MAVQHAPKSHKHLDLFEELVPLKGLEPPTPSLRKPSRFQVAQTLERAVTMASIRKRANGKFCVQIRITGHPHISKTFNNIDDAKAWAECEETRLASTPVDKSEKTETLLSIARKYCDMQLHGKPSCHLMLQRLERIAKHFPQEFISISRMDVNAYKSRRLLEVSGPTVREEIQAINKLFRWAEREMIFGDIAIRSPAQNIALPPSSKPLNRVVERHELEALLAEINPLMREIVEIAYETAMRRSEIIKLTPRHLDLDNRVLLVENGKTGDRTVPLTRRAIALLRGAQERCRTPETRLYPVAAHSVSKAVRRARDRAGLDDHVRMHQLRHTRITEVAKRGFNQAQIMMVSGHRDVRSVQRYTHLCVKDVLDFLE